MGVFGIPAPVVAGLAIVAILLLAISIAFCEIANERYRLYVSTFTLQVMLCMICMATWWTTPMTADEAAGAVFAGMFIIPTELVFGGFIVGCARDARND